MTRGSETTSPGFPSRIFFPVEDHDPVRTLHDGLLHYMFDPEDRDFSTTADDFDQFQGLADSQQFEPGQHFIEEDDSGPSGQGSWAISSLFFWMRVRFWAKLVLFPGSPMNFRSSRASSLFLLSALLLSLPVAIPTRTFSRQFIFKRCHLEVANPQLVDFKGP